MGRVGISLTGLTTPCSCVCHKPAPGFLTPYAVVIFMLLFDMTSVVVHLGDGQNC